MKKAILLGFVIILMLSVAGCSNDEKQIVEDAALSYTQNAMAGNWQEVMKGSTGEQLGILLLLSDQLKETKFKADIRLSEVIESNLDGKEASVIVHVVRDVTVADYGTIADDRQILLHLYNLNGEWKVYRMDVILEK